MLVSLAFGCTLVAVSFKGMLFTPFKPVFGVDSTAFATAVGGAAAALAECNLAELGRPGDVGALACTDPSFRCGTSEPASGAAGWAVALARGGTFRDVVTGSWSAEERAVSADGEVKVPDVILDCGIAAATGVASTGNEIEPAMPSYGMVALRCCERTTTAILRELTYDGPADGQGKRLSWGHKQRCL